VFFSAPCLHSATSPSTSAADQVVDIDSSRSTRPSTFGRPIDVVVGPRTTRFSASCRPETDASDRPTITHLSLPDLVKETRENNTARSETFGKSARSRDRGRLRRRHFGSGRSSSIASGRSG